MPRPPRMSVHHPNVAALLLTAVCIYIVAHTLADYLASSELKYIMADDDRRVRGQQRAAAVAALLVLAGLLLVLCGLTLSASVAGLAVAAPLLLLFSPVLAPATLLAWLLATGAAASAALALGAFSILSRLLRAASPPDDHDLVEDGRRRVGEVAAVAGERTPHAALAVVSRGQGATDHKKPQDYEHYVAGRMVQTAL
ncbi:oleosin 18 kDa-like [Panicum virgatum]|uniref:oleosin 18 kDa-like n=1 Tax=Panicum virgatum TaxID=38727 RepID=UPI0019D4FB9C|nr:oleosin 18 kDa-like [Panicum virgatum]